MLGNPLQLIQWLYEQDKNKRFEVKEWTERKTKDQNSYAWKMITEIGNVIRKSKEEVYFDMLKNYGQSEIVSIRSDINPDGFLKYYEEIGSGVVNDTEFTHYKVFKGSSQFDKKEMSIYIDGIIQECDALNIPHLTKEEILLLKFIDNTFKK